MVKLSKATLWGDGEREYLTTKLPSLRAACVEEKETLCLITVRVCVCVWRMCLEALTNELTL